MSIKSFLMRLSHSPISLFAIVLLVVLAWSSFSWYRRSFFISEFHAAARQGDLSKVKALLKDNAALIASKDNENGWTPLHWAVRGDNKDVAAFLLANKAEVNAKDKDGFSPLYFVQSVDVIKMLY
jgi:ankyrin repeat protein